MKQISVLTILLCFCISSRAQFFTKLDDDFKFNGLNLSHYNNDNPLKGCTLLQETEWGKMYKPAKEELKTKGFTLKNIRYYADPSNPAYVWLITAISTDGIVSEAIIRNGMASGASRETRGKYNDDSWHGYERDRTFDIFYRMPMSDTCYVILGMRIATDRLPDFPSQKLLSSVIR